MYSLFGLFGGAVVGLLAAVLDHLIRPAAGKVASANKATADADPSVWPPTPKRPQ